MISLILFNGLIILIAIFHENFVGVVRHFVLALFDGIEKSAIIVYRFNILFFFLLFEEKDSQIYFLRWWKENERKMPRRQKCFIIFFFIRKVFFFDCWRSLWIFVLFSVIIFLCMYFNRNLSHIFFLIWLNRCGWNNFADYKKIIKKNFLVIFFII